MIAQHTCPGVTQLSTDHIGINSGPEVITDSSPHIVQADLHTTSVWCCPTNQPDITSTTSCRREILFLNLLYHVHAYNIF